MKQGSNGDYKTQNTKYLSWRESAKPSNQIIPLGKIKKTISDIVVI
jgi:hypothetical protein